MTLETRRLGDLVKRGLGEEGTVRKGDFLKSGL